MDISTLREEIEKISKSGIGRKHKPEAIEKMRQAKIGNKNRNKLFTFNNKTMNMTDWAKELELNIDTISKRVRSGWDIEKAMTTPNTRKYKK